MYSMLMTLQCVQKVQHGKQTALTQCFPVPSLYPKAIYNHLSFIHSLTHSFTSRVHEVIKQPTGCAVIKHLQEKDTQNNSSRWNLANLLELPQTFFTSASRRPPLNSAPSKLRHGVAGGPAVRCPRAWSRACGRPSPDRWLKEARRWTCAGPQACQRSLPATRSIHHPGLTGGHYRGCPSLTLLCTASDW